MQDEPTNIIQLVNFMIWCQSTHGEELRGGCLTDERWRELAQEWDEFRKPGDDKTSVVSEKEM